MWIKSSLLAFGLVAGATGWIVQAGSARTVPEAARLSRQEIVTSGVKPSAASLVQVASKNTSPQEQSGRDPFVGSWTGDCGDLVQCSLKIDADGDRYNLELTISNWQDADAILCRLSGNMNTGKGGQFLAGKMGSSPLSGAFLRGAGALELHDMPEDDCESFYVLDGIYRILGD